jgi:acyl carrier protein
VTDAETRDVVLRALSRVAPEVKQVTLAGGEALRDQVDIDSMDFLNFIIALHEMLGVNVPESDYPKLSTLDAIVSYLSGRLAAGAAAPPQGA